MRKALRGLSLFLICVLAAGAAVAGCGAKDTHEGTLESVAEDGKQVVVKVGDGETVTLSLTDKTTVKNAEGKKVDASALVGKTVKVVSEHAKVDSIEQTA